MADPTTIDPELLKALLATSGGLQPIAGAMPPPSDLVAPSAKPGLPTLSYKQRQSLPQISPGTPAGSSSYYENQIQRLQDQKDNPWGSPDNHPGTLGKIGHVLGRIGNIAGDIVAPGTLANIPGTDINRTMQVNQDEKKEEQAKGQEDVATERKKAEDIAQQKEDSEEQERDAR